MKEQKIEKYLKDKIEHLGGHALKFNSGVRGVPDRIVLLPGGKVIFVELKAPGKKPRPLQEKRLRDLNELGFHAIVIDSKSKVDDFINEVR
ncbi:VRR-NUC domain-containing protein [Amphibacillus sp. MSJ-3]|uniref:VRR-NUC domain-containing protein n=1 Tax=Amphibacillus sp. MSJ-3 TaxID=2841505 RepID=UPI001C0F3324|nr:VRR-NUC domain-containing protein [Amphibacillus sp. MSJ-3]